MLIVKAVNGLREVDGHHVIEKLPKALALLRDAHSQFLGHRVKGLVEIRRGKRVRLRMLPLRISLVQASQD